MTPPVSLACHQGVTLSLGVRGALIAARAPELTDLDLKALALAHPTVGVSVEVLELVLDVIDGFEARLGAFEAAMKNSNVLPETKP